jgi:hypothetical protein
VNPAWLDKVLAAGATLDLHHPDARAKLAEQIIEAIPLARVAVSIAGSARTVLDQKIATTHLKQSVLIGTDQTRLLSREIGNNAGQAVFAALAED